MSDMSDVIHISYQSLNRAMQMHWKFAVRAPGVYEKVVTVQD